jgi:hypothetical protein
MQSTVCMHKNQSAEYAKISGDTDMRNAKINFQGGKSWQRRTKWKMNPWKLIDAL